jgi:hypothetical protein
MLAKGFYTKSFKIIRILVGMLYGPTAFEGFILLITSEISSELVLFRKKLLVC